MEIIPLSGRKRWSYNKLSPPKKRNQKIVRFGEGKSSRPRSWRLRLGPKLRLVRVVTPLKLWYKFKNAYMKMMLKIANNSGTTNSANVFGTKRIPKARDVPMGYPRSDFENRLILEIYKSMVASLELGYNK